MMMSSSKLNSKNFMITIIYYFLNLFLISSVSSNKVRVEGRESYSYNSDEDGVDLKRKFSNVQGTFWGSSQWSGGNCLFQDWSPPNGLRSLPPIALAGNLYSHSKFCGSCVEVRSRKNPGKSEIGIISDQCPGCQSNALDLSPKIYEDITNDAKPGIEKLDWKVVNCKFKDSISLITKEGSSIYYFSIQVVGHNLPIRSLKIQTSSPTSNKNLKSVWLKTKREDFNYFTLSDNHQSVGRGGRGGGPLSKFVNVKIFCSNGKVILTKHVSIERGRSITKTSGNC